MAKRPYRFHIEYNGGSIQQFTSADLRRCGRLGTRKIESKYVTSYYGWGDTMFPSQVKEKFISDMEKK